MAKSQKWHKKQNGHQKWNYKLVTPSENVLTNAPWLKSEHRQVQPIRAMTGETEARPRRPKLRGRESWFQTDAAGCWGRAETETGKNCLEARQLPRGLHHCGIPTISGAARVGRGKASPYGWTSKNYVICVCAFIVMELLRTTRQIHCKAVEQRATFIHRQYKRDWGTSYSRPPIDPYLTSPRYKILAAPLPTILPNFIEIAWGFSFLRMRQFVHP